MMRDKPAFATNDWAWSYTLQKLAEKGNLNDDGTPTNYGAACAIYKRVVHKYVDRGVPKPPLDIDLDKCLDGTIDPPRKWVVRDSFIFAQTSQVGVIVSLGDLARYGGSAQAIPVEVTTDRGSTTGWITPSELELLVSHDPEAQSWAGI